MPPSRSLDAPTLNTLLDLEANGRAADVGPSPSGISRHRSVSQEREVPSHDLKQPEAKTQYVLSGQPSGWAAMAKILNDYDDERVNDCKEDIDTLLVFVSSLVFWQLAPLTLCATGRPFLRGFDGLARRFLQVIAAGPAIDDSQSPSATR